MITAEIIKTMRQTNVSANAELTKERVKTLIKAASKTQKAEIETLAGLKRVSIARVYATGSISVKIAVAIAQILGIDPFYLTGEADEQGGYSYDVLSSFLAAKGYKNIVGKAEKPARKSPRKKTDKADVAAAEPTSPVEQAEPQEDIVKQDVCGAFPDISLMTEEEMIRLIQSLFIQAKFSECALKKLSHLKTILVFE